MFPSHRSCCYQTTLVILGEYQLEQMAEYWRIDILTRWVAGIGQQEMQLFSALFSKVHAGRAVEDGQGLAGSMGERTSDKRLGNGLRGLSHCVVDVHL